MSSLTEKLFRSYVLHVILVTALHKRHLFLIVWQSRLPPSIPRSLTLIPPPKLQGSVSVTHHSFIRLIVLSDSLILLPAVARPWCHMLLGVPIISVSCLLFIPHLLWSLPAVCVCEPSTLVPYVVENIWMFLYPLHALFLLFRNPATAG